MKSIKKPVMVHAGVLFAGLALLTVPVVGQQEVAPDHFDDHPAVSQSRKPAPQTRRAAETTNQRAVSSHTAAKAKSKPVQTVSPVLDAAAGTRQAGQNPR